MVAAKKKSRWSILKAEALKDYKPKTPYLFDAVEPSIEIQAPTTVAQTLAIAALLDESGAISERDFKSFLSEICGKSFPQVWRVIKDEPSPMLNAFIQDLNEHFSALPADDAEVEEVPGKD